MATRERLSMNELTRAIPGSSEPADEVVSKVVVVAMDFGTTYSGYAFSFSSNKDDVKLNREWGSEVGATRYKTPTFLLTDKKNKYIDFGHGAVTKYIREKGADKKFNLYERFKMKLYENQVIGPKTVFVARNGATHSAEDIIAMALKFLYDHCLSALQGGDIGQVNPAEVRWVVTVPAIWTDSAKQMMRRAALKAGIVKSLNSTNMLIALEPEAASFWCRSIPLSQFRGETPNQRGKAMPPRTTYMVVDCGGGTLDVTVHEVAEEGNVREIHAASGGDWAGMKVDQNFFKLIDLVLGKEFTTKYEAEHLQDWVGLMVQFETIKRSFRPDKDSDSIDIQMSWSLGNAVQKEYGKNLEAVIEESNVAGVTFDNGMLSISPQVATTLYRPVVKKIVDHVENLLTHPKVKGTQYIFMVGGFSECEYLQTEMKKRLGGKVKKILAPYDAGMCVMKGAVLYGHTPTAIISRIARRTYGESIQMPFDPSVHEPRKKIVVDGNEKCTDLFRVWVRKGESVNVGEYRVFLSKPHSKSSTKAVTTLYSVDRERVMYISEPGVEKVGRLQIAIPDVHKPLHERLLKKYIYFGGTEIKVRVEDTASPGGDVKEIAISFFSE